MFLSQFRSAPVNAFGRCYLRCSIVTRWRKAASGTHISTAASYHSRLSELNHSNSWKHSLPRSTFRQASANGSYRSSIIVSNQYWVSWLSAQRTFSPSTANTVIIEPPGNLLKTSSPRLNASTLAIVTTLLTLALRLHKGPYPIYNAGARAYCENKLEVNSRCVRRVSGKWRDVVSLVPLAAQELAKASEALVWFRRPKRRSQLGPTRHCGAAARAE
jgi:hypothetical protein